MVCMRANVSAPRGLPQWELDLLSCGEMSADEAPSSPCDTQLLDHKRRSRASANSAGSSIATGHGGLHVRASAELDTSATAALQPCDHPTATSAAVVPTTVFEDARLATEVELRGLPQSMLDLLSLASEQTDGPQDSEEMEDRGLHLARRARAFCRPAPAPAPEETTPGQAASDEGGTGARAGAAGACAGKAELGGVVPLHQRRSRGGA
mmetsp:Transcript_133253/g.371456  ORF Transcript_133253/g.371456 Transcript_133253/m.371456 type:complete len:209 (-) Transcript_133253:122-748(-)